MNEVESTPLEKRNKEHNKNLVGWRHETRAYGRKEYETAMVWPRNKNDKIWTALRLKMEGINKNLQVEMILEEMNNI